MSSRTINFPHCPRNATLAACLAAALGLTAASAHSSDLSTAHASNASGPNPFKPAFNLPAYLGTSGGRLAGSSHSTSKPDALPHYVTSCDDDIATPGTLRYEVANAPNGATIDLSTLVCSTITLGSEIAVLQDSLSLQGPQPQNGSVTIDAYFHSRVFDHTGAGTLSISNLTVTNGYETGNNVVAGGCIYSAANVDISKSIVSHCTAKSTDKALGGAIYTHGSLASYESTISSGDADGTHIALGGGAYVGGDLSAKYSTVSYGSAHDHYDGAHSNGGGIFTLGNATIQGSTFSENFGEFTGALQFSGGLSHTVSITNSTISTNTSARWTAGIYTNSPLTLANSTVAFNTSNYYTDGIGLFANGAAVQITSSIIASNVGAYGMADFSIIGGTPTISSSIITSGQIFAGASQSCPQLEPLADNGGFTLTHALRHTSPAIDQGWAPGSLTTDQRLAPRVAGVQADIGAVEWQPGETEERIFADRFDGATCD